MHASLDSSHRIAVRVFVIKNVHELNELERLNSFYNARPDTWNLEHAKNEPCSVNTGIYDISEK